MASSVRLKHQLVRSDATFFFYEGERPVKEGVIEIETDNPDFESWVRRAYLNGYTLDPDTDEPVGSIDDVLAKAAEDDKPKRRSKKETPEVATTVEELKEEEKLYEERSAAGREAQEAETAEFADRKANVGDKAREEQERYGTVPGEDNEDGTTNVTASEITSSGVDKSLPSPKGKPANPSV